MNKDFELAEVRLPDFGVPEQFPKLDDTIYSQRLDGLRRMAADKGLQRIVVYADREHFANLSYLCGLDPRFEEALLIVSQSGDLVLITGPENQAYAQQSPVALRLALYPPFGLLGQDRSNTPDLAELLVQSGLGPGKSTGVVGWKYFTDAESKLKCHQG